MEKPKRLILDIQLRGTTENIHQWRLVAPFELDEPTGELLKETLKDRLEDLDTGSLEKRLNWKRTS